ncbi:MAG: hypothetical protein WC872_04380, partial [Candidatus Absconditabacterales bacterium]
SLCPCIKPQNEYTYLQYIYILIFCMSAFTQQEREEVQQMINDAGKNIHKTITIVKSKSGVRQVQFVNIILRSFSTLEEAKSFAKTHEYGKKVEVWENDKLLEEFDL